MTKLEINDKVYNLPSSWDELTLEQYCKAFYNLDTSDKGDEIENLKRDRLNESYILSRLLGESDDFCINLPITVYEKLVKSIRFMFDIKHLMENARADIKIDGKIYMIPPFNEMPLRQYIDSDVVARQKDNPYSYIELLAILLTPKDDKGKWIAYDGKYEERFETLKKMSCSEALGIVYHYFKKKESSMMLSKLYMKEVERLQHLSTQGS
jgi:hypothetical protein